MENVKLNFTLRTIIADKVLNETELLQNDPLNCSYCSRRQASTYTRIVLGNGAYHPVPSKVMRTSKPTTQ